MCAIFLQRSHGVKGRGPEWEKTILCMACEIMAIATWNIKFKCACPPALWKAANSGQIASRLEEVISELVNVNSNDEEAAEAAPDKLHLKQRALDMGLMRSWGWSFTFARAAFLPS